ncbi:MAG: SDR family oxidoreductase [Armatimonadetes bacterium]|nr:SDR family oxidoreductase [Armatimonadota bacterium]
MKGTSTQRVVLITGAGGNLGAAVTRRFLTGGAAVAALDTRPFDFGPFGVEPSADPVLAIQARIDSEATADRVAKETLDRFGRIDGLVHLIGGWGGKPVVETTLDDWQRQFAINLTPAFLMVRAVLPEMIARGAGRIVCVASRTVFQPVPKKSAYTAAKAGLVAFAASVAAEVKEAGVTCNCVVPSVIDTPQNRTAMPQADPARWVTPERLAEVIHFLCSENAGDVTGAAIPVYGRL